MFNGKDVSFEVFAVGLDCSRVDVRAHRGSDAEGASQMGA
jgi:hypothetical protein